MMGMDALDVLQAHQSDLLALDDVIESEVSA